MNTRVNASIFASCSLVIFFSSTASAQVQRTFVSGLGSDSNPCTRTAPCRTFGQAMSQTNPGGEVYVLDTAGYGPFTINKTVSIVAAPGITAGISVFSGDGITINGGASDTVTLRGLTINNQGSTGSGIIFNTGGILHIENCVINGFSNSNTSFGLKFPGPGNLEIKDSIIRANFVGILVLSPSGIARAAIDQVRLEGGGYGLIAREGSRVVVRNSVASSNSFSGFHAAPDFGGSLHLSLEGCIASNNDIGIVGFNISSGVSEVDIERCVVTDNSNIGIDGASLSTGRTTVRLSNSTVTGNATGILAGGSPTAFLSRGNNTVEGNAEDIFGTIGSYSAK